MVCVPCRQRCDGDLPSRAGFPVRCIKARERRDKVAAVRRPDGRRQFLCRREETENLSGSKCYKLSPYFTVLLWIRDVVVSWIQQRALFTSGLVRPLSWQVQSCCCLLINRFIFKAKKSDILTVLFKDLNFFSIYFGNLGVI